MGSFNCWKSLVSWCSPPQWMTESLPKNRRKMNKKSFWIDTQVSVILADANLLQSCFTFTKFMDAPSPHPPSQPSLQSSLLHALLHTAGFSRSHLTSANLLGSIQSFLIISELPPPLSYLTTPRSVLFERLSGLHFAHNSSFPFGTSLIHSQV